jgi:AraC-like DNA-binding protein
MHASSSAREAEPTVTWQPAAHLDGVHVMSATDWRSDLAFYHDSVDFCSIERIEGDRGPRNFYRRWAFTARPRDLLLFEPGHTHRATGGPRASYRVLLVSPTLFERARVELTDRVRDLRLTKVVSPEAYVFFERLQQLLSHNAVAGAIQEAFAAALEHVIVDCAEQGRTEGTDDRSVHNALEYIDDLLSSRTDQHLSLERLVEQSGASGKFRLCRDFKRATHLGIYQYFKLRKFALARQNLVRLRGRSIQHVAWDMGYTINAFSRAFHEQFGVSPREYRAAFHGSRAARASLPK